VIFLANSGSSSRTGLVSIQWIPFILWITSINLSIHQVVMPLVGYSYSWYDFVAFGLFGMKETKDFLLTKPIRRCSYWKKLRCGLFVGWKLKMYAFLLDIIYGGNIPLFVWGLADVLSPLLNSWFLSVSCIVVTLFCLFLHPLC